MSTEAFRFVKPGLIEHVYCSHTRLTEYLRDSLDASEKRLKTLKPKFWFSDFVPYSVYEKKPQLQTVELPPLSLILNTNDAKYTERLDCAMLDEDLTAEEMNEALLAVVKDAWDDFASEDVRLLDEPSTRAVVFYNKDNSRVLLFSVIEGVYEVTPEDHSLNIGKLTQKLCQFGCRTMLWRTTSSDLTPGARMREALETNEFVITLNEPERMEVAIPLAELEGIATKEEITLLSYYVDYQTLSEVDKLMLS